MKHIQKNKSVRLLCHIILVGILLTDLSAKDLLIKADFYRLELPRGGVLNVHFSAIASPKFKEAHHKNIHTSCRVSYMKNGAVAVKEFDFDDLTVEKIKRYKFDQKITLLGGAVKGFKKGERWNVTITFDNYEDQILLSDEEYKKMLKSFEDAIQRKKAIAIKWNEIASTWISPQKEEK